MDFTSESPLPTDKKFHNFSWDILSFILEGKSAIDLPALAISSRTEAYKFLQHYGYDYNKAEDRIIVEDIFSEAIRFIKTYFCNCPAVFPEELLVPPELERLSDVRTLLIWASASDKSERQAWSCAVLRVMHTIHHLNNTESSDFFQEIKRQILDRFKLNIHIDASTGHPVLGHGAFAVPLYCVDYKEEKSRDSLIIKLLQKPKNVSEKIHDRLGVKFVTANKVDALRVLRCLTRSNMIMFANVTPDRSRNNLLNLPGYRRIYEQLALQNFDSEASLEKAYIDLINSYEGQALLGDENVPSASSPTLNHSNPNSSDAYHSIQFTVQQLVKVANPSYFTGRRIRVQLEKSHMGPELESMLREFEGSDGNKERRILFPIEVQIIDKENYRLSIEGPASHDAYKERQLKHACRRVMAGLIAFYQLP